MTPASELAELKALAQKLVQRLEKMEADLLTAGHEPSNTNSQKPTAEDHISLKRWLRKRGRSG